MQDSLKSAAFQVFVILIAGAIFYTFRKLIRRGHPGQGSYLSYMGLLPPSRLNFDGMFWGILSLALVFSAILTWSQYTYMSDFREFLLGATSPYGKILSARPFGPISVLEGFVYCFVAAGLAEELLFRGLIARRFYPVMAFWKANALQAFIFWFMHWAIFRLVTGQWINALQVMAFVVSFGMGMLNGYLNQRRGGQSLAPGWVMHGSVNFVTFLTLAAVAPPFIPPA